jgi:PAS domain S-box-containing protein
MKPKARSEPAGPRRSRGGRAARNQPAAAGRRIVSGPQAPDLPSPAADEASRRREDRYRLLFNHGSDAVFVHELGEGGLPGKFLEVNDVACRKLGYTREELLRLGPVDIDAPETHAAVPRILEKLRAENAAVWEAVHVAKDGRRFPVELSARRFEFEGTPAIVSVARDITARKRAEQRLARLTECLLGFGPAAKENITRLVALCGEVLGASCALYNRRNGDLLEVLASGTPRQA